MVKSPKTGRELEPDWDFKAPKWLRELVRGPDEEYKKRILGEHEE